MKKKIFFLIIVSVFLFSVLIVLIGCSKNENEILDTDITNDSINNIEDETIVEENPPEKIMENFTEDNLTEEVHIVENETNKTKKNITETKNTTTQIAEKKVRITIYNMKPDAKILTITKGTIVEWYSKDKFKNLIVIKKEDGWKAINKPEPFLQGESYKYQFNEQGNYIWYSSAYPKLQGQINVG